MEIRPGNAEITIAQGDKILVKFKGQIDSAVAEPDPQPLFKVGDRVRVKQDLQIGQGKPDKATVVESMLRHAGKTTIITDTYKDFGYCVDCDNGEWAWTSEMLEPFPINYAPENKTVVTQSVTYKFEGAKTTCIIQSEFGVFKGCAKCNPTDEWHEETGKRWAYLRANKKMIELTERVLREG